MPGGWQVGPVRPPTCGLVAADFGESDPHGPTGRYKIGTAKRPRGRRHAEMTLACGIAPPGLRFQGWRGGGNRLRFRRARDCGDRRPLDGSPSVLT